MPDILKKDKQSITAAVYHLKLASEYLKSFQLDCGPGAKRIAALWSKKSEWILNDIFCAIDPPSRERFREDVTKGDPVFLSAIGMHLLAMSPEQRALIEKIAEGIAAGEELEFVESS